MTELTKQFYFLLTDARNPAHIWFPNNSEFLKLAEYLGGQAGGIVGHRAVRGKWIFSDVEIICSSCDSHWDMRYNDTVFFNYCPSCGAKMDKKE